MFEKTFPRKPETDHRTGGIFGSAAQNLKSRHRLGDLLVASHLISAAQLQSALEEQKVTGAPLGTILIQQKALTAVQLYHKLAEQWCLRIATAGVTVLLQTTIPTPAQAYELDNAAERVSAQFTLAASTARPAVRQYPSLFGAAETRNDDITAFKKWTQVITRFENQLQSVSARAPRALAWKAEIQRLQSASTRDKIEGVNAFLNQIPYIEDIDNYNKGDYWATPLEFLSRGGDCEDYAIAKYASLRALGFTPDQMRIAIVTDKVKNIPHAVLIVYSDDGSYVLDNQNKRVQTIAAVSRYEPIFSINSNSWWLHRA